MKRPLAVRATVSLLSTRRGGGRGLTLVEMLIAMSITLLMMAAVVTVFANISGSVSRRRATIEMSSALRGVRETLSRDLENATCPALPWRRPEANEGYLEIIEGPLNDHHPSIWLWDSADAESTPDGVGGANGTPGIDLTISSLPGSNLRENPANLEEQGSGLAVGSNQPLDEGVATDGRGLGDGDDVLMLTVRNENQPFVGRVPNRSTNETPGPSTPGSVMPDWGFEELESPLAEVAWFTVENPPERPSQQTFAFGEPGYRTVYRRTLLIAPWLNYRIPIRNTNEFTGPGVVRVLGLPQGQVARAVAALIAFQERYDLSVRLEWDPVMGSSSGNPGRWVLRANSLADLTKRENRFEHHGLLTDADGTRRGFPFNAVSAGGGYAGGEAVQFVGDAEYGAVADAPEFEAVANNGRVVGYQADENNSANQILAAGRRYPLRPLAVLLRPTAPPATARAILNEDGSVVRVVRGLAPLGGSRRGDDVMLTNALAFDIRVYDPGAPVYGYYVGGNLNERADRFVEPGDPAWPFAFLADVPSWLNASLDTTQLAGDLLTATPAVPYRFERFGAYVDLGYGATFLNPLTGTDRGRILNPFLAAGGNPVARVLPTTGPEADFIEAVAPPRLPTLEAAAASRFATPFATYDTWSWHYENNGLNEDGDDTQGIALTAGISNGIPAIDEGTDGFDSSGHYELDVDNNRLFDRQVVPQLGPDDTAERETRPPYPAPMRGVQVSLRVYERDSLQIREVKVRESFVPE